MNEKQDLSLVPIEDLLKEVEGRCSSFVLAFELHKDKRSYAQFIYGKGSWYDAVRLAAILNNDVLNNWNGELKTLQRISEEEDGQEETF